MTPTTHPEREAPGAPGGSLHLTAPARVNLLGEFTDYTGGLVLPIAIPFQTTANLTPAPASYTFLSTRFDEPRTLTPEDRTPATGQWSDYPTGVLRELQLLEIHPPPFTLTLGGNVPLGAGLSSSASVEVATAFALLRHAGATLPPPELALLCQRAENNYVHSPCGIMDQFVIVAARAGHALLLNTGTLETEHIPMAHGALADTVVIACNSMIRHSVATGDYGTRRRQVHEGEEAILARFPDLKNLSAATLDQLESVAHRISREAFLRCRHIITENARVRAARTALLAGDPVAFGRLMLTAHASQRDDFQVSTPEIDFLVDTAAGIPGCFGARMTGGGFGGCTVNLVARDRVQAFTRTLRDAYKSRFNTLAEIFPCEPVDGALLANPAQAATQSHEEPAQP